MKRYGLVLVELVQNPIYRLPNYVYMCAKILSLLLLCSLSFNSSITAFATEPSENVITESEMEEVTADEDGLEVVSETSPEEVSGASSEISEDSDSDTDLSSASENESDDEITGQAGDTIYDVSDLATEDSVPVTFKMNVPTSVTDPCIVSFVDVVSFIEYYVEAYRSADYTVTVYMKPGTYSITDGYPTSDNIGAYSVRDKSSFIVSEDDVNVSVSVTIRSKGDLLAEAGTADTEEEVVEEVTTEEESVEEEKDYTLLYLVLAAICLGSAAVIMTVWLKVSERKKM